MFYFFKCFILLLFMSCQLSGLRQQKVDPTLVGQPTGINPRWFLPSIPTWINFSSRYHCEKERNYVYLDLSHVVPQLGLSYRQALELQARVNQYPNFLTLSESDKFKFFFDELTKVVNKIELINPIPDLAKTVSIVYIDQFQASKQWKKLLEEISLLPRWNDQLPVLVSECLSTETLQKYLSELPSGHPFQWFVGAEFYSVLGYDGLNLNQWQIDWNQFFPGKKILIFNETKSKEIQTR